MSTNPRPAVVSWIRVLALLSVAAGLSGCGALAITALGVGASAGVSHTASGVSYRTFTATAPQVKAASLAALSKMGITVAGIDKTDGGELIKASYADRSIEIELEAMSKSTTQMRASAKRNLFVYDAATAKEIVEQTERAMAAAADKRGKAANANYLVKAASSL
ncbi:hypothetical protein [Methylibium sp.]|uniref:hypothetical protein n=1 Tax=Methylibium sp. TaxID=2067992 RepID=UPI003D0DE6C0